MSHEDPSAIFHVEYNSFSSVEVIPHRVKISDYALKLDVKRVDRVPDKHVTTGVAAIVS